MSGGADRPRTFGVPHRDPAYEETSVVSEAARDLPSVDRLLTLSDGVVAIAMTLIVLQITVPEVSHPNSPSALANALGGVGNEIVTYVISFFVIAQFWLAHHRVFRLVRGHREGLAWVNFAFLFAITLMPFTANLLGKYGNNPVAVDIFAFNLLLASLSTQAVIIYGRRQGLLVPGVRSVDLLMGRVRSFLLMTVAIVSMAVAWYSTDIAHYVWIGFFFAPSLAGDAWSGRPPGPVTRWVSSGSIRPSGRGSGA